VAACSPVAPERFRLASSFCAAVQERAVGGAFSLSCGTQAVVSYFHKSKDWPSGSCLTANPIDSLSAFWCGYSGQRAGKRSHYAMAWIRRADPHIFGNYWLLGRRSKLNLSNKLLIYKVAIKPIWTYGIQLGAAASTSNIGILERYQSKALRLITDAPWYVPNAIIRRDLQVPSVKEEIRRHSAQYYAGLCTHPNLLPTQVSRPSAFRRLRRHLPSDLPHRFTV
jgi:carbonic anhydrase